MLSGFISTPINAQAAQTVWAGTVSTTSGNLNVRSSASVNSSIKTSLPKGSFVTVISENGDFYYVRYSQYSYGYCHKNYIKAVSVNFAEVNTNSGNLNVRTGMSTSYSIKNRLPKGEKVVILSSSGGWSKILYYGNKTGYVSSAYLKLYQSEYKTISLSVPSYKQTDKRWADTTIGSSGKTIAKIGCATTSVAMMESYRKGYTIYPDTMSKMLSYSSSGNVYWPSHYKVCTSSADYLEKFYEILNMGKPVLFGAKNRYGAQHWIVVTGFTGGELTAENFSINDPGSNIRTNLQQFLNSYPQFYKYFTY